MFLGGDLSRDTLAKIEAQIRWVSDFEVQTLAEALGIDGPELLRLAIAHRAADSTKNDPLA